MILVKAGSAPPTSHNAAMPHCPECDAHTAQLTTFTTRTSNRNGNAGRKYLKCVPCKRFVAFLDDRGVHASNPTCFCNRPSRLQIAGAGKIKPRGLHYVCVRGGCDFYEAATDDQGEQYSATERLAEIMIQLKII